MINILDTDKFASLEVLFFPKHVAFSIFRFSCICINYNFQQLTLCTIFSVIQHKFCNILFIAVFSYLYMWKE